MILICTKKNEKPLIQIAGHNIYNLDFQKYFIQRYKKFLSITIKLNQECVVLNTKDASFSSFKINSPFFPNLFFKIWKTKRDFKEDNVSYFAEEIIPAFIAALLMKEGDKLYYLKVDWHYEHHNLLKRIIYQYFIRLIDNLLFLKATKVLCFNQAILEKSIQLNKFKKNIPKFSILYPRIKKGNGEFKKNPNEFIFFGILREDQRIEQIIHYMRFLVKEGKQKARMHFFGSWSAEKYRKKIQNIVDRFELSPYIKFYGYTDPDDKKLIEIARKAMFGFAYFDQAVSAHTYYAWPSKIIFYLTYRVFFFFNENSTSLKKDFQNSGLGIPLKNFNNKEIFNLMKQKNEINIEQSKKNVFNKYQINDYF